MSNTKIYLKNIPKTVKKNIDKLTNSLHEIKVNLIYKKDKETVQKAIYGLTDAFNKMNELKDRFKHKKDILK